MEACLWDDLAVLQAIVVQLVKQQIDDGELPSLQPYHALHLVGTRTADLDNAQMLQIARLHCPKRRPFVYPRPLAPLVDHSLVSPEVLGPVSQPSPLPRWGQTRRSFAPTSIVPSQTVPHQVGVAVQRATKAGEWVAMHGGCFLTDEEAKHCADAGMDSHAMWCRPGTGTSFCLDNRPSLQQSVTTLRARGHVGGLIQDNIGSDQKANAEAVQIEQFKCQYHTSADLVVEHVGAIMYRLTTSLPAGAEILCAKGKYHRTKFLGGDTGPRVTAFRREETRWRKAKIRV
eukprot:CAMPEP_0181301248 /NCGR_PEP_ID=MMETSP1101-20121128/7320_1 /TAXON_ID=46948 /ORGANISM="Rhodomonas abbreviata, Strain Caron Lab Isolate" /LENGTH=286 /DNA_ID=CAMNT_0023406535 /DNA_START=251 /DNA_END=1108 /DNA_ORIENTATION=-